MTTGWKLDRDCRDELMARFAPRYAQAVADHVTLLSNASGGESAEPPGPVADARIIGRADDGKGVDAMVVAIDGSPWRPDGGAWHITWSLGEGRRAKESNDVIAARGWQPLDGGALTLFPARW